MPVSPISTFDPVVAQSSSTHAKTRHHFLNCWQILYSMFDKSTRDPFQYPRIVAIIEISTIGQCALP